MVLRSRAQHVRSSMTNNTVTIIGAGLAGSLLSIYLAKRGMQVSVFEARGDMRKQEVAAGRSINLALSDRGIAALREVGMDEYMLAEAVPMTGRMIHSVSGETKLLPYSGRQGEYINSVSRAGLNIALINEAEKYPNVQFVFNERCTDFHLGSGEATFESGRTIRADTVIATDGAGSAVRESMHRGIPDFQLSQVFLEHGYKELHIPSRRTASVPLARGRHGWSTAPKKCRLRTLSMAPGMRSFKRLHDLTVELRSIREHEHMRDPRHRPAKFCLFNFIVERPVAEVHSYPEFFRFNVHGCELAILQH